jgi:hypothetical protein
MTELTDFIKSKRNSLSASSLKTYTSILKNLYKKVFGDDEKIDEKKFDDTDKIIEYLKDYSPNKRKTILSALVVITGNSAYRNLMMEDIQNYKIEINKQEKTDEQKENWIHGDELNNIFERYKKEADLLYKKEKLKMSDLQDIQNYIILCLLSGKFIPPRRSMDYVNLKIKGPFTENDNYIEKNKLIFNSYKTSRVYGRQELNLPKPLQSILKKWTIINPTDYLLFDANKNKLTNVKLTQRLNRIFGKKASINQLRHTYLTDKYKPLAEEQKKMENDMKKMGSSTAQSNTYIKLD